MAEAFLRHYAKGSADVFSAGLEAHGMNPMAVKVLQMAGLDVSSHYSKTMDEFIGQSFDYILTVCDHARENCPYFPGNAIRIHQNFPDPAKATGTDDQILQQFIKVRNEIDHYCREFIQKTVQRV